MEPFDGPFIKFKGTVSGQAAKCISKFILIMENNRSLIDEGTPPDYIGHRNPTLVHDSNDLNVSDHSLSLSSVSSGFFYSSFEE